MSPISPAMSRGEFNRVIARDRYGRMSVSGGTIPVYREGRSDLLGACDCAVGQFRQEMGMRAYDSFPGTERTDTKHDVLMAEWQRRKEKSENARIGLK